MQINKAANSNSKHLLSILLLIAMAIQTGAIPCENKLTNLLEYDTSRLKLPRQFDYLETNRPSVPLAFSSNLPIVVINTKGQQIQDEPKIEADMGIIFNSSGARNSSTDSFNHYFGKIGIEIRGNFSASLPQKPYRFETWDSTGNSANVSLLGMPSENDWVLLATYNDKSFVRNSLSSHLFEAMGHYATRSAFVELELNGQYQGIYMLSENIKRDKERVNIAKLNIIDNSYPEVSGGYIIKTDYWDNTNSWLLSNSPIDHPNLDIHLVYHYPSFDIITSQQKKYIQTFIFDMETALYNSNFADSVQGYRKYISTKSFMDYFFVNELARNVDGYKKSCYYYKEKDNPDGTIGKLKAGPVWDFDWAWKDIWDCTIFQATDGSGWSHRINDCPTDNYSPGWMIRFLQDSTFVNEMHCRWKAWRNTILDTSYIFNYMDSVSSLLYEAQKRHYTYWGHMGRATGTPEVQSPRKTYNQEMNFLKSWIRRRLNWLDANMPGKAIGCKTISETQDDDNNGHFNVKLYPNPFHNEIEISLQIPKNEEMKITVYNSLGKEIIPGKTFIGTEGKNIFPISIPKNISQGLLIFKVQAGQIMKTLKAIHYKI